MRRGLTPLLALSMASCTTLPAAPPAALGLDPFYTQYVDAGGIPVLSSYRVDPQALYAARDMIAGMLAHRRDLREELVRQGYRVAIIAQEEALLDLPENRDWTKPAEDDIRLTRCERKHYAARIGALSDREYWDRRARGIGGERTVGSEEDILGLEASRYYGETIFVHEFAHNVLFAIEAADPALYAQVEAAYDHALATGLWKDEYTVTTVQEYWAEGSQFWFESNRLQAFAGQQILSREDMRAYDPQLYNVLAAAYGDTTALKSDPFHLSPARVPPGPPPENTAEVC